MVAAVVNTVVTLERSAMRIDMPRFCVVKCKILGYIGLFKHLIVDNASMILIMRDDHNNNQIITRVVICKTEI